jgi:hypothetical protein
MYKLLRYAAIMAASSLVVETKPVSSCSPGGGNFPGQAKAVYFITNDQKNAVAAVGLSNGLVVGDSTLTETGGAGSASLDATSNPAAPDALVSQGSVVVVGKVRFDSVGRF